MQLTDGGVSAAAAPRRGTVQGSPASLSYLEWGARAGPAAILLHGITSNAQAWWRVAPRLAERGLRVLAFDMPGHGHSGEVGQHAIRVIAGLIADAMRAIEVDAELVIGHSWGGAVAISLATEHLVPMRRLVLLDPALALTAEIGATRIGPFTKGTGSPAAELAPGIAATNPDWHEQDVRWKAVAMEQCRREAVAGFFTKSGDWDLTERLSAIPVPALLLRADPAASIIDAAGAKAAEGALRRGNGVLRTIPGTTHNLYRGAGYEPTLAALLRWLDAG